MSCVSSPVIYFICRLWLIALCFCLSMILSENRCTLFRDHALVEPALRSRVAVPVERLVVGRDHHALDVEVVVEALGAEFAADAGIVDAAPGRSGIEAMMVVDPDDAGLHFRRQAMGARDVAGADRRCKAER